MRDRRAIGLQYVPSSAGEQLARLAGIEGLTRAVMVGTVPLAALEALGSKQAVSVAFFVGATLTLFVTVNVGRLERLLARRWVLTAGVLSLFCAAALFAFGPSWTIPLAIGMRSAQASVFSVCLSLYIMDFIGKADLARVESRRSFYLAGAWLVGPALGTWMWTEVGSDVPFLVSMGLAVVLVSYHWYLRLDANPVLLTPTHPVPSPIVAIPRFFGQRSLRISYVITLVRASYWSALFVYGPLYVVEAGLPSWTAGVFLSVASSVLFLSPLVLLAADRFGVRASILVGFSLMGVALVALAVIGDAAPIGILCWFIGAIGGGIIDVLGNIPFMRLVKPRERAAMVGVFSTWREVSFLVTPGLAALILALGPFWLLYAVLALLMVMGAIATSYLPRRL